MKQSEIKRFATEILPQAEYLEKTLPRVFMRISTADFLRLNNKLWEKIVSEIITRYPQYQWLKQNNSLAFRTVYRPKDNNATLPGFDQLNINLNTVMFWFGMDYQPQVGEHVGMVTSQPWSYYMLPDVRYNSPEQFHTWIYIYDNSEQQIVPEGQTTTIALPKDNYLATFLKMAINISWVIAEPNQTVDSLIHDCTLETPKDLLRRAGIEID